MSGAPPLLVFERPMPVSSIRVAREFGFQSATQQVCRSNNWLVTKKTAAAATTTSKPLSHYSYKNLWNMGKLAVPKEHTALFYKAYLSDFFNGWFGAFTENPGEGCMPLYFDYDLWSRDFPAEEFWKSMELLEKTEVMRFFPERAATDAVFQSTVAVSGVIDVCRDDGTRWFKCGIHIYYPRLFVTVDMALYISTAVLAAAEKMWPRSDMTWDKQIDRGVYGPTRGLRMVYMFKAKPCPKCSSGQQSESSGRGRPAVRTDRCDACDGARVVSDTSASMYAPLYRVDGTCARTAILPACRNHPTLDLLLECSLRAVYVPEPTEGFYIYPGAIPIPVFKTGGTAAKDGGGISCSGEIQMANSSKTAQEVISRDTPRWVILQQLVRRVDAMYSTLDIKSVFKMKSRNSAYKVFVGGKGSGYCQNYGKDHRTATVYFYVTKTGVTQMCWCKCDTLEHRVSGLRCRDFRSKPVSLLQHEISALFDTATAWGMSAFTVPTKPTASATPTLAPLPSDTDADAFTKSAGSALYFKDLKKRQSDYFYGGSGAGSISAIVKTLDLRPLKK
jgi:hypothetical protein